MKKNRRPLGMLLLFCGVLLLGLSLSGPARPASGTADAGVSLPIIMYHHVLKDPSRLGEYVVSPQILEDDFAYLKRLGYESVVVQDLIDYVQYGEPLPERPIMITFDDGYLSNLVYAYPLLEKYDLKAVISVVGAFCQRYTDEPDGNPAYAQLSWDQVGQLAATGRFEIQNHSYNLHQSRQGASLQEAAGESLDQYRSRLQQDLSLNQQLIEQATGSRPTCMTYPFGLTTDAARQLVQEMGFSASLGCYERVNLITRDPECLFDLGRFNRAAGLDRAAYFELLAAPPKDP